jgi:hypothetical protein
MHTILNYFILQWSLLAHYNFENRSTGLPGHIPSSTQFQTELNITRYFERGIYSDKS